jgi:DNA polymerase-3 subunit gamma/tau
MSENLKKNQNEKNNNSVIEKEESYLVTARRWRPRTFSDVTSQNFITTTLLNSIKHNRISHAYLFSGPRGVGKTTIARLLAKSLNCSNLSKEGEPCNNCDSCREINNDNRNHPDVFEIDGASNRNIEDIRDLKEKVRYGPVRSKYKIFIIDEVHMLTGASFNALLKTLEEPPKNVIFIFATTAPEKVPLTILGRCQKFDFKRLKINEISARLKLIAKNENIKIDDESLLFISKKGDGSMRDAQGLFDISAAYCNYNITYEKLKEFFNLTESDVYFNITDYIKKKKAGELLRYFDDLMNKGYDMQVFLSGLTEHYRNLLVAKTTGSSDLIIDSESAKKKYTEAAASYTEIEILNSLKLIIQTDNIFKYSSNQRTLLEALLFELIKFTDTKEISELLNELKKIKAQGEDSSFGKNKSGFSAPSEENPISLKRKEQSSDIQYKESTTTSTSENFTLYSGLNENADLNTHWLSIKAQIKEERKWVYSIIKDTTFEQDEQNN